MFIKDKTLRSGHTGSSDEEYEHVDSEELEDSDPDFIDYSEVRSDKILCLVCKSCLLETIVTIIIVTNYNHGNYKL